MTLTNPSAYSMSHDDAALPGKHRLNFHALAAQHGDCIVLSYGDEGHDYRIVVDAGVEGTAERLKKVLNEDPNAIWELLVVSHIDADHIGGVLTLLADKSVAGRFQDIWFNGRHHLDPPGTESLGVAQGIELQEALCADGISWNRAFGKNAVCLDADVPVKKTLDSGAKITLLSPTLPRLTAVRHLWDRYLRTVEEAKKEQPSKAEPAPPGLERMGGEAMNISNLAATKTQLDGSATNASSIAFLFEFGGKRLLLGADANPKDLVAASLHVAEEVRKDLHVFKLPHHGSAKNVTESLLRAYSALNYVVSTNGDHHGHPDDVAIARVVESRPDARLLFNYAGKASGRWQEQAALPGKKFTVLAGEGEEGVRLRLL
ncbi:MBL fold metallo-hydrolase [Variovorax sp. AFSI2.2]|uniref:MBL fold metallo-hydrolase n=1 Tax=Variovorax sp. AFSI2.2 TaxID=3384160 RepID=UPI003EBF2EF4